MSGLCPNGWEDFGRSCYYIDIGGDRTKIWDESRERCQQELESDLAVIETEEENNFIWHLIEYSFVLPTRAAWIGLQRNNITGVFEWIDGTPFLYDNWKSGEPNNVKGNENCVFMKRGGEWNDDPCDLNGYSFWEDKNLLTLCEKPL